MHMADALVSPAVGGAMWAATAAAVGWSAKRLREEGDDRKVPLMGVLGAFVFTAQMINFTIPGTGSSGHLGGGMILAALLGPHAACLVMASVLTVQALFFADGGLLALGCNVFNLGVVPSFVAYPLVFRPIAGRDPSPARLSAACVVSAVAGLQAGAFGVVLQTVLSGISELPFRTFALVLQPIHLAIGVVEGLATAAVVGFVRKAQPGIASSGGPDRPAPPPSRRVIAGFLLAALLCGGVLSWFASEHPDGLEWAVARVSGKEGLEPGKGGLHGALSGIQEKTALLPDYGFRKSPPAAGEAGPPGDAPAPASPGAPGPSDDAGSGVAGLVGGAITLAVAGFLGWALRRRTGSPEPGADRR